MVTTEIVLDETKTQWLLKSQKMSIRSENGVNVSIYDDRSEAYSETLSNIQDGGFCENSNGFLKVQSCKLKRH